MRQVAGGPDRGSYEGEGERSASPRGGGKEGTVSNLKDYAEKAKGLAAEMTTDEKANLVSGAGMWETRGCDRLGLKKIDMSDGPHGIRKQLDYADIAADESVKTVCFPSGSCISGSWDTEALRQMGEAIGRNARIHDISLLLGPGTNIKRSPLCGRNFEYFSEDPHLAGVLVAAYIRGVQSVGVSACVKHFAGNNQETRRLTVNALIDERALREIYLPPFETAIREGNVDTVMSAYNTLNGTSCSQNKRLLTEILREEWGFDGMVVSDWGAVTDDTEAVLAGTDLKMPGFGGDPARIEKAVNDGTLSAEALDEAAARVIALLLKANEVKEHDADWGTGAEDFERNHALSRRLAGESMVLLKNDGALPLKQGGKLLIVGAYAREPHFQGGGSSHVNAYRVDDALGIFEENGWETVFVPEFSDIGAMLEAMKTCDTALVFAGTPESEESEGFDRETLDLPEAQNTAIFALCEAGAPTVVILFEGSAAGMPWVDEANAVLAAFLPGEAGGGAVYDLVTGAANPCGKLAETFARKRADTPAHLFFPGEGDASFYGESLFVGYRYYEKKEIEPLFPFGHGLSYTVFAYESAKAGKRSYFDNERAEISVDIKNVGWRAGKEIVQLYVRPDPQTAAKGRIRPVKELKAFEKIDLAPGEIRTVRFLLERRAFAFYDTEARDWRVNTGNYSILIGASSVDIRAETEIEVISTQTERKVFTRDSLLGDFCADAGGKALIDGLLETVGAGMRDKTGDKPGDDEAHMKMVMSMPLKTFILLGVPAEEVDGILAQVNAR
ncbi:MAG: glycoside hydrolase family 3 C-terminal domain-containing protein [Clostridiales Family XIII bacterium]|nr:glycoside hydrolase family 3 C-terminal domain-containing protein [Clostridiales Family XIII bacterium]